MSWTKPTLKFLPVVCLAGATFAASAAHADFFDAIGRIFGGERAPAPQVQTYSPYAEPDNVGMQPLDMTVRPRRVPRAVVRKAPRIEAPVETASMDPVKNPDWFLDDPTLRRGDIVVLKGEVLVFEGGGSGRHRREEFSSLAQSKLPSADKQRLREMAGLQMPAIGQTLPQVAKGKAGQVTAMVSDAQN